MSHEPTPQEIREMLEKKGASQIRLRLIAGALPLRWFEHAVQWLAELDDAERSRSEASQASQMRTALSASRAAWIAAKAAIVAAVIAIIGTVVTVLAWIFPRH